MVLIGDHAGLRVGEFDGIMRLRLLLRVMSLRFSVWRASLRACQAKFHEFLARVETCSRSNGRGFIILPLLNR